MHELIARYLLPAFMVGLLVAVLVAVNRGFLALSNVFSSDFPVGFIAGCAFCGALYYIIRWLEPSGPNG